MRRLRNQNEEHFVNLCESNILETKVPSGLAWTLFPVESTSKVKIKITHHRVIGDGCIWEGISLINACWVSQSVFYQVLQAVSDDVFKENV